MNHRLLSSASLLASDVICPCPSSMQHMTKYLLSSHKVNSVHITNKSIYFTISTYHPKETFFFFFQRNYSKGSILSPAMSPSMLEGQILRMIDLISILVRQLKYYIIRIIVSYTIFVLGKCLQIIL